LNFALHYLSPGLISIGSFLTDNTIKEHFLILSRIMGLLNLSIRQ